MTRGGAAGLGKRPGRLRTPLQSSAVPRDEEWASLLAGQPKPQGVHGTFPGGFLWSSPVESSRSPWLLLPPWLRRGGAAAGTGLMERRCPQPRPDTSPHTISPRAQPAPRLTRSPLTNTQRPQGRLAHPGDSSPGQVASTCPSQAGSCPPAFPGLPHAPNPNRPKASLQPAAFALLGRPASRATAAVWHPPGGPGLRLALEGPGLGSQRPHSCSETGHLKAGPTVLGPRPGEPRPHVLKLQQPRPVHTRVITCRELGPPAVLVRPHLAVPAHRSPPPLG